MATRELDDGLELLLERVDRTLTETGDEFPYYSDPETGEWVTTTDGNWCAGYWIHMLWMAFDLTGDESYATAARGHAETMTEHMTSETMFCGLSFYYGGFRAYDISGDERDLKIGLEGANAMADYYHEGARQVPVGVYQVEVPEGIDSDFRGPDDEIPGHRRGVVDAIHAALSPLWHAYHETNDPTYWDVAISHADRHLDWYIREDGSTWHVALFDPQTGALERQFNDLAYSDETCWARGQGWCIAGLAQVYTETGDGRYLNALERVMEYYVTNAPDDLVPHWDFEHPNKPTVPRDTSCAALAAYGLSLLPAEPATRELRRLGDRVTTALVEDYLTPTNEDDDRPRGMVLEGCFDGPAGYADQNELLWTDHYLLETLYRRLS